MDSMEHLPRVWVGPVSRNQVGARATDRVDGCTGDGANATERCRTLAARKSLASIASSIDGPFALCAFSAGGQAIKEWSAGLSEELRDRVAAVFLFDAIYETRGEGYVDPGLVEWCVRAAQGRVWFVATSSANPNKDHGSGIQVAAWLRDAVTKVTGQAWTQVDGVTIPGLGPPAVVHRLGQALFFDWPDYEHAHHVTVIAPTLLGLDLGTVGGSSAWSRAVDNAPALPLVLGVGAALCALTVTLYVVSKRNEPPPDLLRGVR